MKLQITAAFATNSNNHPRLQRVTLLIALFVISFAVASTTLAVVPSPDGGYPNANTAEGANALGSLTTGSGNTAVGFDALLVTSTGSNNTATGSQALVNNSTGGDNTAIGSQALLQNTGSNNTATGASALLRNTTGTGNTASGDVALFNNQSGSGNTAVGDVALYNNSTGNSNIALGSKAGINLTTGSNNIDIGNAGVADDSNTIRIGRIGIHTRTFIAGVTNTNPSGAVTLWVTPDGQLAVLASSARFKDDIKPMSDASDVLLALRPVTFHYRKQIDPERSPQFGLIAEEVEKINPALVTRDREGKAYTVRYEAVNAMLLNEFLKEHCTVQELKSTLAKQQKQIEALTTGLQKVSAQVEANKPAPQVVDNNQ